MHPLTEEVPIDYARRSFWWTAGIVGVALLVSIAASYPANVLKPSPDSAVLSTVNAIFPQGWSFFTKDPQDVEIVAYRPTGDTLTSLQTTPQSRIENAWGLTRTQRAQGPELAAISNQVTWTECVPGELPSECFSSAKTEAYDPLATPVPHPFLCGEIVLVQEKPVAWGFRDLVDGTHTAERIARASITCDEESP